MAGPNDGTRTLSESALVPEVAKALSDWIAATNGTGVLIGGVALSFYIKPRYTQDVDLVFISDDAIPTAVRGFKKTRPHGFQHVETHVEIEAVTPSLIDASPELIAAVVDSAVPHGGIKIATPSGIVAIKLGRACGRSISAQQDRVDISLLISLGGVDISQFPLGEQERALFQTLQAAVHGV
jgi:hypothetical protein